LINYIQFFTNISKYHRRSCTKK